MPAGGEAGAAGVGSVCAWGKPASARSDAIVRSSFDDASDPSGASFGAAFGGGDSPGGRSSSDGRGGWFGGTVTMNSPLQLA